MCPISVIVFASPESQATSCISCGCLASAEATVSGYAPTKQWTSLINRFCCGDAGFSLHMALHQRQAQHRTWHKPPTLHEAGKDTQVVAAGMQRSA